MFTYTEINQIDWGMIIVHRLKKYHLTIVISLIGLLLIILIGHHFYPSNQPTMQAQLPTVVKKPKQQPKTPPVKKSSPLDWHAPSEKKSYPDPAAYQDFWIDVSIAKQRVYLKNHNQTLYTMYASTGAKASPTPQGTFAIQPEHGEAFYNPNSGEGAKYWRSFLDHGIYLFHSVPTDQAGNFIPSEAQQLGQQANSHGCIRLTVADAQWFYTQIPVNTPVKIH